jgi:hypothetical protein
VVDINGVVSCATAWRGTVADETRVTQGPHIDTIPGVVVATP